jgi:hypothetical protein
MEIRAAGTIETRRAPADAFTGTVGHDPIIDAPAPARVRAARVSFEPGARTAGHTHPLGQTLHVRSGVSRARPGADPFERLDRETLSGSHRVKGTGKGPRPALAWSISPCRKRWTNPTSPGWSTCLTSSTTSRRRLEVIFLTPASSLAIRHKDRSQSSRRAP